MPGNTSKKIMNFGKSNFPSIIGTIYYIWQIQKECSEAGLSNAGLNNGSYKNSGKDFKNDYPGQIIIFLSNSEQSYINFTGLLKDSLPDCSISAKPSLEIEKKLLDYLSRRTREIKLNPCYLFGTDFEKKIWETARKIPYGDVASYKELAEKAGYPNAFRAAGTALGNNPLMLVVPCHRVIRSNGEVGYFGGGEEIKLMLLDIEQPK